MNVNVDNNLFEMPFLSLDNLHILGAKLKRPNKRVYNYKWLKGKINNMNTRFINERQYMKKLIRRKDE